MNKKDLLGQEALTRFSLTTFLMCLLTFALTFGSAVYVVIALFTGDWSGRHLGIFFGFGSIMTYGITVGWHRHLTHHSFEWTKVGKWLARPFFLLAGCATWQSRPIWWAATHAAHHSHSDQLEGDPHGPVERFLQFCYVQLGCWVPYSHPDEKKFCARNSQVDWFVKLISSPLIYLLVGPFMFSCLAYLLGGWQGVLWYLAAVFVCWHITQSINSVTHLGSLIGYRAKKSSGDNSTNVPLLALIGGGEGLHHWHHLFQKSARFGQRWWEIMMDGGYLVILIMRACGLVAKVNVPTKEQVSRALTG